MQAEKHNPWTVGVGLVPDYWFNHSQSHVSYDNNLGGGFILEYKYEFWMPDHGGNSEVSLGDFSSGRIGLTLTKNILESFRCRLSPYVDFCSIDNN